MVDFCKPGYFYRLTRLAIFVLRYVCMGLAYFSTDALATVLLIICVVLLVNYTNYLCKEWLISLTDITYYLQ